METESFPSIRSVEVVSYLKPLNTKDGETQTHFQICLNSKQTP